jgi:broad specificity phosphatase PhoE
MGYDEAEADPGYMTDRTRRWKWTPEGGGESYEAISLRVKDFLSSLLDRAETDVLVVTHAVTLRLFRAVLEGTLPSYPENIPGNGELWSCSWAGVPTTVHTLPLGPGPRKHAE